MYITKICVTAICLSILSGCETYSPFVKSENTKQQQAIKAAQDETAKQIRLDTAVRQSMRELYDKNPEILLEKLKQNAAQGSVNAQYALGLIHETGRGVQQNYKEALHWYKLAAAQGDARAQYRIGVMYENGTGVERNLQESANWFKLASTQSGGRNDGYGSKVRACIQPSVAFPTPPRGNLNPAVQYRVDLRPDGTVANVKLTRSSGNPNFDRAVETGIRRCSPFPAPPSGKYPGYIDVIYNMYD